MNFASRKLFCLVALGMLASTAFAQTDSERFQRQLEQIRRDTRVQMDPRVPPGQRVFYDYGLYLTPAYLSVQDTAGDTHSLRQFDAVGYARLNIDGVHELLARTRSTYRDYNEDDSFDPDNRNQYWKNRIERLAYRFSLQRYQAAYENVENPNDVTIMVGRQLASWGNGLVLNQDVDGAQVDINFSNRLNLSILASRSAPYTIDFDASRPNFDDDTKRLFIGAMLQATVGRHRPFVYFLSQKDQNDDVSVVVPTGGDDIVTSFKYDSQYIGFGSTGTLSDKLLYSVEAAFEIGTSRSRAFVNDPEFATVTQTDDPIRAAAIDARLDYLFDTPYLTRAVAEVIVATGDDDRLNTGNTINGNAPGTVDRAFNAYGLLNTGLAFSPSISNLILTRVGMSTYPFPSVSKLSKLEIGFDVFTYNKLSPRAPSDQETADNRYLGFEPDLFLNWQVTTDVTLSVRYGIFFPGDAISRVDEAYDSPRQFLYTGVTFAF